VRLDALLAAADLPGAGIPVLAIRGDVEQADILTMTVDSHAVQPGALYCCIRGQRFDGHDFAPAAVAAGAAALLCERPLEVPESRGPVPQIVVPSVRPALGPLAAALNGNPSEAMTVIGVTGTNGKTTTVHLLAAILQADGRSTATLGTLTGTRTTPEAPVLQATLAEWRRAGVEAVAMEVSSHALGQHRVDAVHFAAGIFTNLSQDHLDYHHTMEAYFDAKSRLFDGGRADIAVINADDVWGRRLLDRLAAEGRVAFPYSFADVDDMEVGPSGTSFRWAGRQIGLKLGGRFNVANAIAAATAARALGLPEDAIVQGLQAVKTVRGRFEPVEVGQPFTVLIDYAHTPDGLEQALTSARELVPGDGQLTVVFGCGGDRDHEKRPQMGGIATRLADVAVLTSDNPRSEDPLRIIDDVRAGAAGPGHLVVEPDRARAIAAALSDAKPGDVVIIAGKGHETGQEIDGRTIPFDDADVARGVLQRERHLR
jgi:UDP-N-acetylmuramoyl-L-alanyl-D-glutamate--2,6-diaminopimelate ligase